jgi:hypothetical protein
MAATFARVPEATVHEDRQLFLWEIKIGASDNGFRVHLPATESSPNQGEAQSLFRTSISFGTYFRHQLGSRGGDAIEATRQGSF